MKAAKFVTATQVELDEVLAMAKTALPDKQYRPLEAVLGTFTYVMPALLAAAPRYDERCVCRQPAGCPPGFHRIRRWVPTRSRKGDAQEVVQ